MNLHSILIVAVVALVTIALRFLPFVIFRGNRETPKIITYLGKYLPYAIMAMLVVYCLKSITLIKPPHGIPEMIAVAATAGLHIWKRNNLLSIGVGTIL